MQHHRGRATTQEVWVFGMVDTSSTPALGVMVTVPNRSAQTHLPIMQRHLWPGTTDYSDQSAAYRNVQQMTTVAQHFNFVDPPERRALLESGENEDEGSSRRHGYLLDGRIQAVGGATRRECDGRSDEPLSRHQPPLSAVSCDSS